MGSEMCIRDRKSALLLQGAFCISLFIQIKAAGKVTVRLHGGQVVLVLVHLYIVYTKAVCRCVIIEQADLLAVRSSAVAGGDHPIYAK